MRHGLKIISAAGTTIASGLARIFADARPCGWQVGSARNRYDEFVASRGLDATRYGDWEYSGRCTDF